MSAKTPDTGEPACSIIIALNMAEVDQMCQYLAAWGKPLVGVEPQLAYIDTAKGGTLLLATLADMKLLEPGSQSDLVIIPNGAHTAYRMGLQALLPTLFKQPIPDSSEVINTTPSHTDQLRQLWQTLVPTFERYQWDPPSSPDYSSLYRAGANLVMAMSDKAVSRGYSPSEPIRINYAVGNTIPALTNPTQIWLNRGLIKTTRTPSQTQQ